MTDQVASTGQGSLLPDGLYRRALEVGRRAAGVSGPNPPVGCLLVVDGVVIAEGATEQVGGRHAEVVAIAEAGERARGSVAVVTLEPCAHHGRTPPCTEALVAAGVAEVHVLLRDPDPVAAGGLSALRRAGLGAVDVGDARPDLAAAAAHDLRGFVARVLHGRPHVTLKLAQTPDGRTVPGDARYLTGIAARRRVHALRADSDAVLVGGGTVRADDPQLDVRHVPTTRAPRPVLVTTRADVSPAARAVREGTVIVHGPSAPAASLDRLAAEGCRLVEAPLRSTGGGIDLAAALGLLLEERVLSVLAEPGVRLAASLLDAGLVDTLEVHVARGSEASQVRPALPALAGMLGGSMPVERMVTGDGDLILRVERLAAPAPLDVLEGAA